MGSPRKIVSLTKMNVGTRATHKQVHFSGTREIFVTCHFTPTPFHRVINYENSRALLLSVPA